MFWSFLIILFIGVDYCFGSFFEFEKEVHPDDIYNQNQIYLNRKERFIKFDTKDNELEIEFGISVPFMKIPLATGPEYKHGGGDLGGLGHGHGLHHEHEEKEDKRISINGPGLIVAGMLMLTSFLIIPFLFAKANEGFGFRRMASEDNAFWRVVKEVDDVLSYNRIDSSTCGQKAMCWIAKTSKGGKDGSIGKWIESLLSTWWVSRLIDGTFVDDAVSAGYGNETCSMKYPQCPIRQNHLKLVATTFMSGFSKR